MIRDVGVAVLTLLLATLWSGYRFRAALSRESTRRLMSYSLPMFVSRSVEIVLYRVDRATIGGSAESSRRGTSPPIRGAASRSTRGSGSAWSASCAALIGG